MFSRRFYKEARVKSVHRHKLGDQTPNLLGLTHLLLSISIYSLNKHLQDPWRCSIENSDLKFNFRRTKGWRSGQNKPLKWRPLNKYLRSSPSRLLFPAPVLPWGTDSLSELRLFHTPHYLTLYSDKMEGLPTMQQPPCAERERHK